jgi:hypothetical protein
MLLQTFKANTNSALLTDIIMIDLAQNNHIVQRE